VAPPTDPGYGTSVIRDLIPYELGGSVELDFSPTGVCCRIEFVVETEVVRLVNPGAHLTVLRALGEEVREALPPRDQLS